MPNSGDDLCPGENSTRALSFGPEVMKGQLAFTSRGNPVKRAQIQTSRL